MEPLLGKTIDNYQITEIIARGGMGVVFKALDTNLDKVVAIKMIDPFLARDTSFVKRFKTEAQALAKLENQHIVTVHALRDTESGLFMVMEYVESKSLSQLLKEKGPFSAEETLSLTTQLLDALAHAHSAGVIHRDIKPGNVLVTDSGKVKVTDFGLAKVVQQRGGSNTMTQTVAGTLYYMSPEQIKGLKNVDIRSDIYSLGMTMYEMLAGRIPFDKTESDFTVQKAIVDGEIPSPAKFNAGIPKKLVKIITKSIDKNPDKRYQTAGEMLADIQEYKEESVSHKKARKPLALKPILSSTAAVIVIAALAYFFFIRESSTEISYLTINTYPPHAEVKLNDKPAGTTPMNNFLFNDRGEIKISINKEGYIPLDTIMNAKDSINIFNFSLVRMEDKPIAVPTKDVQVTTPTTTTTSTTAAAAGIFSVDSDPPGATVILNGKTYGTTPFRENTLAAGTYKMTLRMKGYRDLNESVKLSAKEDLRLSKKLNPAGSLQVNSDPPGAEVQINNKSVGKTPWSSDQQSPGQLTLTVSKPGYKTHSEKIEITTEKTASVNAKLVEITGKIEVLVRPYGSIYIDGQLKAKDSNSLFTADIPGGTHKIKAVHPTLGTYEREISISDDKPVNLNIDLSKVLKLTIVSTPGNCEVILNGQTSNMFTPAQLRLSPGSYKIQLKKDGYNPSSEINYTVPAGIYESKTDQEDRYSFELIKSN
jgi:eukaryotic-like serine/threonine-protein kinase